MTKSLLRAARLDERIVKRDVSRLIKESTSGIFKYALFDQLVPQDAFYIHTVGYVLLGVIVLAIGVRIFLHARL